MKHLTFEISDESVDFLRKLKAEGYAEYRDYRYDTLGEFIQSDDYKNGHKTVDQFLARNFNGTGHLVPYLVKVGLVEDVEDAWHSTYTLSKAGEQFLNEIDSAVVGMEGPIVELLNANLTPEEWNAISIVHKLTNRLHIGIRFDWEKSIDVKSAAASQIIDETVFLNRETHE